MLFLVLGIVLLILGAIIGIFGILSVIGIAENINGFGVDWGWTAGLNVKNVLTILLGLCLIAGGIVLLILR